MQGGRLCSSVRFCRYYMCNVMTVDWPLHHSAPLTHIRTTKTIPEHRGLQHRKLLEGSVSSLGEAVPVLWRLIIGVQNYYSNKCTLSVAFSIHVSHDRHIIFAPSPFGGCIVGEEPEKYKYSPPWSSQNNESQQISVSEWSQWSHYSFTIIYCAAHSQADHMDAASSFFSTALSSSFFLPVSTFAVSFFIYFAIRTSFHSSSDSNDDSSNMIVRNLARNTVSSARRQLAFGKRIVMESYVRASRRLLDLCRRGFISRTTSYPWRRIAAVFPNFMNVRAAGAAGAVAGIIHAQNGSLRCTTYSTCLLAFSELLCDLRYFHWVFYSATTWSTNDCLDTSRDDDLEFAPVNLIFK